MAINPNFTRSIANSYRKASFQNKLVEKFEDRQAKADDYFSDMFGTAESRGLPAYEEATARAKDLKRISRTLRDRYNLSDAQILALAQRPTGLYGSGLKGIEAAITKADNIGSPITENEILSLFEMADQIKLPEGMTFEDGIEKLAGLYVSKASKDPNAKDERNTYANLISSALSLNPKLDAQQLLRDTNIGGISAYNLYQQTTTLPSTDLFDVTFTKQVLDRRTMIEDNRLRTVEFKAFLSSFSDEATFETSTEAFTANSSTQSIYADIPQAVFQIEQGMNLSQTEAVKYVKKQMELLQKGVEEQNISGEEVNQIATRINNLANGQINALEIDVKSPKKKSIFEYNFDGKPEKGDGVSVLKISKKDQNNTIYGAELKSLSIKISDFFKDVSLEEQMKKAQNHIYMSLRNNKNPTTEEKLTILKFIVEKIYKGL